MSITPKVEVKPTHTYDNAPRDLDILLIGGPSPATVDEGVAIFARGRPEHKENLDHMLWCHVVGQEWYFGWEKGNHQQGHAGSCEKDVA
jgi:hypothetical protein